MCAPHVSTRQPIESCCSWAAARMGCSAAFDFRISLPYLPFVSSFYVFVFLCDFPFRLFFRGFLLLFFFSGTSFFAQNLNYYLQWLSTCCFFVALFFCLLLLKFLCNFSLPSTFARTAPTKLANFIWYFQFSFLLSFRLFFCFCLPCVK